MSTPPAAASSAADLEIVPKPVAALPLLRAVIDQLEIRAVLDELLPTDPRSKVSDAECVTVMLLNILHGRVALYDMQNWVAQTDVELLLGAGCPAEAFNDTRLAGCLDHIAEAGPDTVFSRIVSAFLKRPGLPTVYNAHLDTTSICLQGAYAGYDVENGMAVPTYGYSKDLRPDLKQLVFGMTLHGGVGIPLVGTMFSGNMSDPVANRFHLDALVELLPDEHDVTVVGDCKLVDRHTLGELLAQGFHFVSLVPHTFGVRGELINAVRDDAIEMPELDRVAGRRKDDPPRIYRGKSVDRAFEVGFRRPDGVTGHNDPREVKLRFLVVESTQLEEQEEEALERKLTKERDEFDSKLLGLTRRAYACEADAKYAIDKLATKLKYHAAHVDVVQDVVTEKRARRGRPRADEPAPTAIVYRLVENEPLTPLDDALASLRFHARHFVLVTDHLDREAWPDSRILAEYRHQHVIEGSTGFRWLKNVATVAPVFLHTPARIGALGVVLLLALMVRNYIQFELRRRLVETASHVPNRLRKPAQNPTTETAMIPFATVTVLHVSMNGVPLGRKLTPLSDAAKTVLSMLGVDESEFLTPPPRKLRNSEPSNPGM